MIQLIGCCRIALLLNLLFIEKAVTFVRTLNTLRWDYHYVILVLNVKGM